ncbi:MAG: hypothetical protein JWR39_1931 [Devosia sp.]|nr:hypothetical protein [Devosia sp.]
MSAVARWYYSYSRDCSLGAEVMTFLEWYAFVILPALVVAIGAGGAWLHLRDLKSREVHPAE